MQWRDAWLVSYRAYKWGKCTRDAIHEGAAGLPPLANVHCVVLLCSIGYGVVLCYGCYSVTTMQLVACNYIVHDTNYLEFKITPLVTYFPHTVNMLISRTT